MKTEPVNRHPLRATVLGVLALVASQTAFAWPDLAVMKTAPAFASVNDLITYTLVYTNQGAITATGVTLTDVLPPQLSPNTNSLGSGSLSGNTITWSLGSITIKKGGTITFQARVNPSAPASGSVTNLARIQSTNADENTNNNSSMAITRIVSISPLTNQTACVGGCAVFCTSVIGGTSPNCYSYTFQWYKGSGLLAGKTGTSLVLTNLSLNDAGTYTVVATGSYGGHLTNSATLTVTAPLTIVTPPANQSVCVGGTATFTVGVTGSPISYQWYKGSVLLTGRTTNSLVLANVATGDAATYSVVVSGGCGTVQTNSATLTVTTPLTIVTPPANQSVCVGGTATFSVGVTGSPVSYQWYKGSALLTGRTTNSLILANVATGDAATYSVVVSGGCGTVQTNSATLTVTTPLTIVTPPANQSVCVGGTATFSVGVTGSPVSYQWYKGSALLTGRTTNSLILANVATGDAATYSVIVSGGCGTVQTNSATLTVTAPLTIVTPPANQSVCVGGTATFSVGVTGSPISYQWYKGTALLTGRITNSLVLANVATGDAATYSVVVSGGCGTVQTNSAILTVTTPLTIVTPPANQSVCVGGTATFTVGVTGSPVSYQWYKGSALLTGRTTNSLVLANVATGDAATYNVVVSGGCGTVQTNSAILTVTTPLTIVTPPANQSVCVGGTATFTVGVTGSPVSYQWYKGSALLTGQTTNSLILANVATGDAATYNVVVSGGCGTVQTNSAILTVTTPLTIVTPPANQSVCVGGTATFTVGVTGSPVSYQWYKGSALLTGQTTNSLVLANVATGDAATYNVVVSGGCGTVQTNSAILSVNASTTTSPLESLVRNVGDTALFTTTPSGTGPFTYVWKKNGVIISVQTSNILVLSNLGYGDEGTYEVDVTGACNTATQSASLHINLPPTVTIFSPTNGTVFVAPASFTLFANAQDPDGTISKVDFYSATNKIGETTNVVFYSTNITAYALGLTNLPAGTNIFTAIATDNNGATGTSAPVSITILSAPPLTIVSSMTYDPLTDLFEETVRVSNPTYSTYQAVRVHITNLQNGTVVWNPSGSTNGIPYVQSQSAVMPGSFVDLVIEYYSPLRVAPNPVLSAELVQTNSGGSAALFGVPQHVTRLAMLSNKTFMVEFLSASNHLYSIEYSSDLKNWQSAVPSIAGDGTWIQWIDNGQPKTESSPAGTSMRFYKVILLQ